MAQFSHRIKYLFNPTTANGMVKAPLISAVYGSSSSFESSAKNALILTQSFPTAVEYGWASSVIINKVKMKANPN